MIPPPKRADLELPFQKLGHYEILERIGHGGMGDVYKGYEKALDRTVAIKVLPGDFSRHDEFVKRFYTEATAAAKLSHPNTIEIYYIGEDSGHHFFAMYDVEGESLAELLQSHNHLSVDKTLSIVEQVLAGLRASHHEGMVHRDIKPGNILLDLQHLHVFLADFGLVKSIQGTGGMTASGVVMGTVDYISPEQGRGQYVDGRSDLYSIGVLLYQLLSGRLPFEADSPTAMIFQHVYEKPRPLNEVQHEIPSAMSAIVSKLMAKSPEARYQNVDGLLADLSAFRAGESLPSGADVADPSEFDVQETVAARRELLKAGGLIGSGTLVIETPHFEQEPILPESLEKPAQKKWWKKAHNWVDDLFHAHAPEFVARIQNTQQQVDGAVR